MALEGANQRSIWLSVQRFGTRLFRLNEGRAWLSNMGPKGVFKLPNGDVLIKSPRSIALGFADVKGDPVKGASDLPGWTTFKMTPEFAQALMGRNIAIFTSVECKRTKGGRTSAEQFEWRDCVRAAGGIAGIVSSEEEAAKLILEWSHR